MSESQLKTFKQSYEEKLEFGKLVYSKNSKKNHKIKPTIANIIINILTPKRYLVRLLNLLYLFFPSTQSNNKIKCQQ